MIRVMLVDDHPVVRQGLVSVLEDHRDLQVVATAGSAEEALALVAEARPDVMLLDLELPRMSGIEAIPLLLGSAPGLQVIVFSAYDSDEHVVGAVRAGARGYMLKGAPAEEVARAIRVVRGGGSHLEPRIAAKLLAEVRAPAQPAENLLTAREQSVLRLLGRGLSNKQIARTLSISERTVKFHVTSILSKLGADNRTQAVSLAMQRCIL